MKAVKKRVLFFFQQLNNFFNICPHLPVVKPSGIGSVRKADELGSFRERRCEKRVGDDRLGARKRLHKTVLVRCKNRAAITNAVTIRKRTDDPGRLFERRRE